MKKGFTLVEILATIVIIALIAGIGVVAVRSYLITSDEKYYNALASGILLAGDDYFHDHRDLLPTGNEISDPVNLNDLISSRYMEQVKDSKGNVCTGYIKAYRENNKYNYKVCLICETDNYVSSGCDDTYSSKITIIGEKKSGGTYNLNKSYNSVEYTNDDVKVYFEMNEYLHYDVGRYDVINTKNPGTIFKTCTADNEGKCDITITESGTYEVRAYNKAGKLIASSQQFSVKIQRNGPSFNISGERYYEIDCSSGTTTTVTFKVVPGNVKEGYSQIKYCINRIENPDECLNYAEYQDNHNSLTINTTKGSGVYTLNVIVIDFAGKGQDSLQTYEFYVAYPVNLEYEDDNTTDVHKVVKGQSYNYLYSKYDELAAGSYATNVNSIAKELPIHKNAYGMNNLDVRWHMDNTLYADERRITGETIVTNDCTYKIKGLMSIPVDIPDTNICSNPTYTGSGQYITKSMEHMTFEGNYQTDKGEYPVTVKVDSPNYIWKDPHSS